MAPSSGADGADGAGATGRAPAASAEPSAALPYLPRIRRYYQALGYGAPYVWARFGDVPFQAPRRPLSASRVAIVTTAAPYKADAGDQGPGVPYNAGAKFYRVHSGATDTAPDLRISHVAIDRAHTRGDDLGSYFPLAALKRAAASGRILSVAPRFHGLPTNRSQRVSQDQDAPEIVARCLADDVHAVLLVANCPVCHQSLAIAAHALEAAGLPTVLMGCARDIVEHVGVPRLLFSDFPLGNAAGRPGDVASQDQTLEMALQLLVSATRPRSTLASPLCWQGAADWKRDYCNIDQLNSAQIARLRSEFERAGDQARALRAATPTGPASALSSTLAKAG